LLDGADAALVKTLEVEDEDKKKIIVLNPSYTVRIADAAVHGLIVNFLTPTILARVVGLESTAEVWNVSSNCLPWHHERRSIICEVLSTIQRKLI
jgi:hypothetical protein